MLAAAILLASATIGDPAANPATEYGEVLQMAQNGPLKRLYPWYHANVYQGILGADSDGVVKQKYGCRQFLQIDASPSMPPRYFVLCKVESVGYQIFHLDGYKSTKDFSEYAPMLP